MEGAEVNKHIALLEKEIDLRKYSPKTKEKYTYYVKQYLLSNKPAKEFLQRYSDKTRNTIRTIYFALNFYYKYALNQNFSEKIPLAKKKQILPTILNKSEITNMINKTANLQHKLILMFLYYAGLRLNEVRNLSWNNLDFERKIIQLKIAKGEHQRIIFLCCILQRR
jgi:integrase